MNDTKMRKIYFLLIVFMLLQDTTGYSQFVWPGDVNNNGIVNKVDLLFLGYAFGETGVARVDTTTTWGAKDLPEEWGTNFPNGVNFLYADCNGDGIVNELDATVITDNLDLFHEDVLFVPDEILTGTAGENPECRFINPPSAVPVDQLFSLEIGLGNMDIPVENLSGFTFILDIEPAILGVDNTTLTLRTDTWIENTAATSFEVQQKALGESQLKVAFTKINRIPVSGSGLIGEVTFVLETDVIDLFVIDTVTFSLDSIIVLDNELQPIPIVTQSLKLPIDKDLKVSTQEHPLVSSIGLYPNPNKGLLLLESPKGILERLEIVNNLGQTVFTQSLTKNNFQSVDFQHLNSGFYWVRIHTEYGIKTASIQKY